MIRAATLRGFTLIELLVSVLLLSVLSTLAYGTLSYVHRARDGAERAFHRMREVEFAVHTLVADFEQLAPRPVREPLGGGMQAALIADQRGPDLVVLTRDGWSNSAGFARGTLQRVHYTLDPARGVLVRAYVPVLDATIATAPLTRDLLTEVSAVHVRYLDASRTWQTQWPPLSGAAVATAAPAARLRPIAVEITLSLKDLGEIVRVVEVAG